MSRALEITVEESIAELEAIKAEYPKFSLRIEMLLTIKRSDAPISKRNLAEILRVSDKSISVWRALYSNGGLNNLLEKSWGGDRKSLISPEVKLFIQSYGINVLRKLSPVRVMDEVRNELGVDVDYGSLCYYLRKLKNEQKQKI